VWQSAFVECIVRAIRDGRLQWYTVSHVVTNLIHSQVSAPPSKTETDRAKYVKIITCGQNRRLDFDCSACASEMKAVVVEPVLLPLSCVRRGLIQLVCTNIVT